MSSSHTENCTSLEVLAALKKYFGHSNFRPFQWEVIRRVLEDKKDQLVVMATGYGKSVCYQFPAIFPSPGLVVVISPLISLMEDQVMNLKLMGISAAFLGSGQTEKAQVFQGIRNNQYRLVYMTPEFASHNPELLTELQEKKVLSLVALDEAHCISQWGHDFRAAYRRLGETRQLLAATPFMALTATATPLVPKDIKANLKLKNPIEICTSFDRPNLFLRVLRKSSDHRADLKSLFGAGRQGFDGPTIIYCPTRKTTEELGEILSDLHIEHGIYHAGLSQASRKEFHRLFSTDQISVMVATVAFGMGIDKKDIRNVIHFGAPKDIESYYQEIGRAGRDGAPSRSIVLWADSDLQLNKHFINEIKTSFREHKLEMLRELEQLMATGTCRRRLLLSHFESKTTESLAEASDCCDNCLASLSKKSLPLTGRTDFSKDARLLFQTIGEVFTWKFGLRQYVKFLRGQALKPSLERYKKEELYGSGKHKSEQWWLAFGQLLRLEGWLLERPVPGGFGMTLELTQRARDWLLQPNRPLPLTPTPQMEAETGLSVSASTPSAARNSPCGTQRILPLERRRSYRTIQDWGFGESASTGQEKEMDEIYEALIGERNDLANGRGVAPYMVASNKCLMGLARIRPSTLQNMTAVEELTEAQLSQFGQRFLDTVLRLAKKHGLQTDCLKPLEDIQLPEELERLVGTLSNSAQVSYRHLVCQRLSPTSVATGRMLAESTVWGHWAEASRVGLPLPLSALQISQKMMSQVLQTIRTPPLSSVITKLTPIREALGEGAPTFAQLKIVLSILELEFGVPELESQASQEPSTIERKRALPPASVCKVKKSKSSIFGAK